MIEVKIKLSEVDYSAAVDVLMPVLLDKLSTSTSPIVSLVLGKAKGLPASAAKAALDVLPQVTKDELAVACLNHYSGEIARLMTNMATQKGIKVKVDGVEVAVEECPV